MPQKQEKLVKLIRRLSYREGEFVLASGQKSSFYIDLKATTLHPDGAALIGELALNEINERSIEVDAVGGMTLGADPIATAVSLAARSKGRFLPAYIVRKEPKSHGTSKYIEGTENLKPGARVIVVEDVVTTGGSSKKAIERLQSDGYKPIVVFAVVDREQGAKAVFEAMGLQFVALTTISEIREAKE